MPAFFSFSTRDSTDGVLGGSWEKETSTLPSSGNCVEKRKAPFGAGDKEVKLLISWFSPIACDLNHQT